MGELLDPKAIPPFAALRAFEAVGRVGGIRKAAERLGLDHAVVSRHIRQLEDWLGRQLFQRTNGRLVFTEAGARYHTRVTSALIELALATSELVEDKNERNIRMWCVPGFAAQWVSEQLAAFELASPEYSVELRPTDGIADLLAHEADIDVRYYLDDWPPGPGGRGLKYCELARPPVIAVASAAVAARFGSEASALALIDGPLLHEEHQEQWRSWFRRNGLEPPAALPGPRLWHAHLAIAAARQGRGVALASNYLVSRDIADSSLVEIKLPDAGGVVLGAYMFVAREDRWTAKPIMQLRKFLQASARRQR